MRAWWQPSSTTLGSLFSGIGAVTIAGSAQWRFSQSGEANWTPTSVALSKMNCGALAPDHESLVLGVGSAIMRTPSWIGLPAIALLMAACATPPQDGAHAPHAADTRPVLYDSLGSYSYRITTASADAQRWFDQGLRLVYAFNHHEAQRHSERPRASIPRAPCASGVSR